MAALKRFNSGSKSTDSEMHPQLGWPEIVRLIDKGESRATEFKSGFDRRAIGRAVSAFANTNGGTIILGVDDTGTIIGVKKNPSEVHDQVTSFLQSGCSAPVDAQYGRHMSPDGWVHWITVPRIRAFEPLRSRGRVYVRREKSSVELSPSELQELFNVFGFVLTEQQVISAATVKDLDREVFYAFLRARMFTVDQGPQPAYEDDLRNFGATEERNGNASPTLFGLMAFGKSPQAPPHTRSFLIRYSAYAGTDQASDVLLSGIADGRLDQQINRAINWTRSLGRLEYYDGIIRHDRPLIPDKALREALVNAVAHRDYSIVGSPIQLEVFSDRLVVTSPGSLPNHMTVESVRRGGRTRSRNESIASALVG